MSFVIISLTCLPVSSWNLSHFVFAEQARKSARAFRTNCMFSCPGASSHALYFAIARPAVSNSWMLVQ